jgi:uncharacterized protein (TIGR03437 family)
MRIILFLALAGIAQAQTFTTVASFDAADGGPNWLVQGADGNFYGTSNNATAFKLTPAGALATLNTFTGGDAANSLVQGSDGNFYGTILGFRTVNIPSSDPGSIFKLTPSGALTILHVFAQGVSEGSNSIGGLVQGLDGNFYGTTFAGGANKQANGGGAGIVFKITPSGTLAKLHDFGGTDGLGPNGLILASDGNFYGTTERGGTGCPNDLFGNGCGTVFKVTSAGTLTTLYTFTAMSDGGAPTAGVVQGSDGNFYGTTTNGGQNGFGTIFKLTPTGVLTTLYSFPAIPAGNASSVTLIQATDGNFYGTINQGGGPEGHGTLFEMTPDGAVTTLHTFGGADGVAPDYLIQAKDGNLYGATASGTGPSPNGTVFSFSLAPPNTPSIAATGGVVSGASFQPGASPGSWITIGGTNLSPKTDNWNNAIVNGALPTTLDGVSVMVGDLPAYIQYISSSQINAVAPDVPAGTVPVTVTDSNGTSISVMAQVSAVQPAFFQWGTYAVATRQDFSLAVKSGTFAGVTTVAAKPGDVIILWGTGFGPTSPSAPPGAETPSNTTYNTATTVSVKVGTESATVYGAALAPGYAGLYQVAIQIPASLANGDYPVVATISGVQSPVTTLITVQQ